MKLFVILFCAFLSACSTPVLQQEYLVRTASAEQKKLPPYPAPINLKDADQTALAQWILDTERRMYDLEDMIKRLIEFYEKPQK